MSLLCPHRVGWYPQIAQNCLSKSVVGVSFDQAVYNFLGFLCYSTFNCALYFNPHVQLAYRWLPCFEAWLHSANMHNSNTCDLHLFSGILHVKPSVLDPAGRRTADRAVTCVSMTWRSRYTAT